MMEACRVGFAARAHLKQWWAFPILADGGLGTGRVFFTAREENEGRELWETDGTPAGTKMKSPGPIFSRVSPWMKSPPPLTIT